MTWWEVLLRLLTAVAIGGIIGIEREHRNRPAGMRTHVLVCLGAAVIAILEIYTTEYAVRMGESSVGISLGRLSAQVVSGIGFLGAGTIFMSQKKIAGLTTAASVWAAGGLGLAAGWGYYLLAGAGGVVVLITLTLLQRVVHVNSIKNVEVRFIHRVETIEFINSYFAKKNIHVLDIDFQVENTEGENICTNIYTLKMPSGLSYTDIVNDLSEYANVQSVRTRNT